jgi:hypothetical protein
MLMFSLISCPILPHTPYVTDITSSSYTPWGIRKLWDLGGLELFGIVVYMLEVSDYVR